MVKLISAFLVLLTVGVAQVHSVKLGETCSPLNPLLWCDSDSNMHCRQQPDGKYICTCDEGNTPNMENTLCYGTYDETCQASESEAIWTCNHDRGLRCSDTAVVGGYGKCKCAMREDHIFNYETSTCVGLSGATCDPDSTDIWGLNCMANAHCDTGTCVCDDGFEANERRQCQKIKGELGDPCVYNSDCDWTNLHLECIPDTLTCQCAKSRQYHQIANGTCVRDYGAECSSLDPCDSERFQTCSSFSAQPGTCRCKSPEHQLYNSETEFCDSIVGQQCGDDKYYPGIECIPNADCVPLEDDYSECICSEGFLPLHDNRFCRPREAHELGDSCDPSKPDQCSDDSDSVCTTAGICECPSDKYPNKAGTRCYVMHGEQCDESAGVICNADRHLQCSITTLPKTCTCKIGNNEVYDEVLQTCIALAGARCDEGDSVWDMQCTENAFCDVYRCACNDGFTETLDKRCIAVSTFF